MCDTHKKIELIQFNPGNNCTNQQLFLGKMWFKMIYKLKWSDRPLPFCISVHFDFPNFQLCNFTYKTHIQSKQAHHLGTIWNSNEFF